MTQKDLDIITKSIVKAVANNIPTLVRRIVREELELNNSFQKSFVNEQSKTIQKKQIPQKRKNISESDLNRLFDGGNINNIFNETKNKVKMPSTGINLLDEYLESTPREEDLVRESNKNTSITTGTNPVPIEILYESDIKEVSVDDALNINYSGFLDMMSGAAADKGSNIPTGVNPRAMYIKDPSTVLQEQTVGTPTVVKQYKA